MGIVDQYWTGVLQRLEAEVAIFARLVAHEGERGRESEVALARVLEALVPRRYGVGTGLLIDTDDHYSRQTDIVIYEQSDEPAVLAQTTQLLFPIESALACIEVKTTLRGPDVEDALSKARDLRSMTTARVRPDGSTHPLFVVLAYQAGQTIPTLVEKFLGADDAERPDLVCVIREGLLVGAPGLLRKGEAPAAGVALLRGAEGDPVYREPSGPEMLALYEGRQYPLLEQPRENGEQRWALIQPARALLLFVEALVRQLAVQQGRPAPVLSEYVAEPLRQLSWYQGDGSPEEE